MRPAKRYLKRLSRVDQERIFDALEQLRQNPTQAPVRPLTGRAEWRLKKVGVFRKGDTGVTGVTSSYIIYGLKMVVKKGIV